MLNVPQSDSDILDALVAREGGFVNHPSDKGGATKFGITAQTLGAFRELGREATAAEVEALTESEARHILYSQYVAAPGFTQIAHAELRALLVDSAVHSGARRAVTWLQMALGVNTDGIIGEKTRHALQNCDQDLVFRAVLAERLKFIGRLITNDPSQAVFAAGWLRRLSDWVRL